MGWKGLPTWGQIVLGVMWAVLFVVAAIQEASIPFMGGFGIIMTLSLLIFCNGSRRGGAIVGIALYLVLVILAYQAGANCLAQERPGTGPSYCGLGALYYLFGLILIPLGVLVGAVIGWVISKVRGKR